MSGDCRYPDFLKDVGATERLRARFAVLLSLNERLGPLLSLVDVTVRRQSLVRLEWGCCALCGVLCLLRFSLPSHVDASVLECAYHRIPASCPGMPAQF